MQKHSVGDPVWVMQPITSLARGKTVHIGIGVPEIDEIMIDFWSSYFIIVVDER